MTRQTLLALGLTAALAGCAATTNPTTTVEPRGTRINDDVDHNITLRECLNLISMMPGMEEAASMTPRPEVIEDEHFLSSLTATDLSAEVDQDLFSELGQGAAEAYSRLDNVIYVRPVEAYAFHGEYFMAMCHASYHFAYGQIHGVSNPDCEHVAVYEFEIMLMDVSPNPRYDTLIPERERRLAMHTAACEAS